MPTLPTPSPWASPYTALKGVLPPGDTERQLIAAMLRTTPIWYDDSDEADGYSYCTTGATRYDADRIEESFSSPLYKLMFHGVAGRGWDSRGCEHPPEMVQDHVGGYGYFDDYDEAEGETAYTELLAHLQELWAEGELIFDVDQLVARLYHRRSSTLGDLVGRYAGDPGHYLVDGLIMAGGDDYGVISGEAKAGKTWLGCEFAVAVSSGEPLAGRYATTQAAVLLYSGEGGHRSVTRRLKAVAEHYKVDPATLPIHVIDGAPDLTTERGLEQYALDLDIARPGLVIIDPLYRASKDVNSASLNEVGAILGAAQERAQAVGAALLVVAHWNQTGSGTGARRVTGAGPWEWARVLFSMHCETPPEVTDDGEHVTSVAPIVIEIDGSNIASSRITLTRTITSTPRDLRAPIGYHVAWREPVSLEARIVEVLAAEPGLTGIDLYGAESPHRVGSQGKVRAAVKTLLASGEIVERDWQGRGRERKTRCLFVASSTS